ncbi:phosphatidylglycerol--membrane-oligosaccharide glycerophosphotransferase [Chimaeribacter arupi]|nr:phosphatidylglycerol--membrane-oligosaccharide glycerophosphotransferase [Chimaeribacter arupi]
MVFNSNKLPFSAFSSFAALSAPVNVRICPVATSFPALFSLLLFAVSITLCLRKGITNLFWLICLLASSLIFILLNLLYYASNYFTGNGINDSVLYTLTSNLEGAGMTKYLLPGLALLGGLVLLFCGVVWVLLRAWRLKNRPVYSLTAFALISASLVITPATGEIYTMIKSRRADKGEEFYTYYKIPSRLISGKKRNLVYLYAESFERTYFDEQAFPGLTPDLAAVKQQALDFSQTRQLPGTEYTIAGMVASQCGIPLFAPFDGNAAGSVDGFYPGKICLGDILKASGYALSFYQGADLAFAGKGQFLKSHGFDQIYGRKELQPRLQDPAYVNDWGLYDDTLLDQAYAQFETLSEQGKPFALFALTVDTHHPDGYVSRSCRKNRYPINGKENKSLSAILCNQETVANFIRRIQQSPYYKDTVIVVSSDHLAMNNTAWSQLTRHDRKDLFFILDGSGTLQGMNHQPRSTLDNGATVLDLLGGDNFIGLGRSTLSNASLTTTTQDLAAKITSWVPALIELWGVPKRISHYQVDLNAHRFSFSGSTFTYPLVLKIGNQKIEPKFETYLLAPLNQQLAGFRPGELFVWVDACDRIGHIWPASPPSGLCLASGKLGSRPDIQPITGPVFQGTVRFPLDKHSDTLYQQTVAQLQQAPVPAEKG